EARLARRDRGGRNADALRKGEAADAGLVLAGPGLVCDPRLDALAHRHGCGGRAGEGCAHRDIVEPWLMLEIAQRIGDDDAPVTAGIDMNRRPQAFDIHCHALSSSLAPVAFGTAGGAAL